MNFEFSEEQVMLRKMVRSFVDKEIMPNIREWDDHGYFNPEILKRLAELNLMGVCIPEKYGGSRIVAMSFCEPRSCIGRLSS